MTTLAEFTDRLRKAAKTAPSTTKTLKLDLLGEGFIRMAGDQVDNEDADADCTLKISRADLEQVAAGELDPAQAFASGRLRIDGDLGVAMELQDVLGRAFG